MRIAILSDIHGNLEALESVLIAIDREAADGVIVLGDIVGYGPDPLACIYRIREADATCVLGNHDQILLEPGRAHEVNAMARETLLSSRQMVGDEELAYLGTFGFLHNHEGAVFSHANPLEPEAWQSLYLFEHIEWCLQGLTSRIAFVGHTHYPGLYCQMDSTCVPLTSSELAVGRHRYLVNVGSVGQPRDGDPRASFALWDVDSDHVQLHRVEYAVQRTQEKLSRLGWPNYVGERLLRGE
jgi:predicted phosphodiesterase